MKNAMIAGKQKTVTVELTKEELEAVMQPFMCLLNGDGIGSEDDPQGIFAAWRAGRPKFVAEQMKPNILGPGMTRAGALRARNGHDWDVTILKKLAPKLKEFA